MVKEIMYGMLFLDVEFKLDTARDRGSHSKLLHVSISTNHHI
jgi:hypothetical protein